MNEQNNNQPEQNAIQERISKHLLELKKRSNEHNLEPVDAQLFAWAQEWAEFYNQKVEQLHPEKKTSHDDKLNKLMYDTVNRMATEIFNAASVLLFK